MKKTFSFLLVIFGVVLFSENAHAAPPAPYDLQAQWGVSGTGLHTQDLRFNYDASFISQIKAFRFYQKRPGASAFSEVATFNNPASIYSKCSGTESAGQSITVGSWMLSNFCAPGFWEFHHSLLEPASAFPVGQYDFYIAVLDASGEEVAVSPIVSQYVLEQTKILSPSPGNSPGDVTTLRWTVPSGWPRNFAHYIIEIFEGVPAGQGPIYLAGLDIDQANTIGEFSQSYTGPKLDPAKMYTVLIQEGSDVIQNELPNPKNPTGSSYQSYISMSAPVQIGMQPRAFNAFNIRVGQITDTSAHVLWETNTPAISTVEYKIGTISRPDGFATVVTSNFITTHDTLLTYLSPNTTYYFYIRLWDSAQNEVRTETVSFKTAPFPPPLTSSNIEVAKPAPKAEFCYTCPQPVVIQPQTVEQIPQQSQPETKEVTRELQGKIQELVLQLQDQIKALQTQIAELNTQVQSQGQELVAVKLELQFTKTIKRGATGEDVQKLQEFLRSFPDVYPEGVVSGYFGPLTEIAVKRFQEKNGLDPVGVVGPKTRAVLNAEASADGSCANSTSRPCFDRVTPGKTIGLAAKAGENALQACLRSKSPSLRGFAHTKTTLSDLESYQYCFEGKSTLQIRFFAGSTGSPIVPSLKPKLPKLSCIQAPEFSTLGWLDPGAPWSISEPSRIVDGSYIYSFVIDTMLKTKGGTLFAAGYGINSSGGWTLVVHKSTDNGVNWSSIKLPDVQPNWGFVHSMVEDHNGVLYAGGTGFWKSTDGGNTWTSLPMPYTDTYSGGFVSIYRMTIAKDNSLIAAFGAGYSGTPKVYKRIDGGGIWSELFSHTYLITSIVETDDGSLVFRDTPSSTEGGVYRYSNGTITKTFTDYIGGTGEPTAGLLKARDGALYLISIDKSVDINTIEYTEPGHAYLAAYKSTDNGITWIKQGTLPNSWTMQGPVIEASDGAFYVASYSVCDKKDAVYKSIDKGVTWSIIGASPTFGNINPDLWYYFVIRDIIEVSGKVLVGGNAPVIFSVKP